MSKLNHLRLLGNKQHAEVADIKSNYLKVYQL
jgi:hypothetical protein